MTQFYCLLLAYLGLIKKFLLAHCRVYMARNLFVFFQVFLLSHTQFSNYSLILWISVVSVVRPHIFIFGGDLFLLGSLVKVSQLCLSFQRMKSAPLILRDDYMLYSSLSGTCPTFSAFQLQLCIITHIKYIFIYIFLCIHIQYI